MLFRSLVAATALLAAVPAFAQEATPQAGDRPDIAAGAAQFVKPTNAERTQVLIGFLTTLGFTPEVQTFEGGNRTTGPMQGSNVVVTVGQGDKDIVMTAHYDAVKLRDGTLSQGIVDNVGSVMAMMEAAKTLDMALEGQPVAHRFVFVFTDQEELGLLGATAFLETHGKDRIAAVVEQGMEDGVFERYDPMAVGLVLKALIDGLAGQSAVGVRPDVERLSTDGVRLILQGLLPKEPGAQSHAAN